MSAKTPEAKVRNAVVQHFHDIGGVLHVRNVFRSGVRVGFPDDTFYFHARAVHVEFKAPGKRPSRKQQDMLAVLRDAGHLVLVVDNVGEGCAALDIVSEGFCMSAEDLEQAACKRAGSEYRGLVAACKKIEAW